MFGEDVGNVGGVFRATEGLQKEFGEERVFDTPLAESAIGGLAVGLGIQGFRPIAEIQFVGFIYEALDQMLRASSSYALPFRRTLQFSNRIPYTFRRRC